VDREDPNDSHVVQRKVVKVWFGTHEIATYVAVPELADRYAAAMCRRFAGLRVTNELVAEAPQARELPVEALWPLTAL
jgi:hypothetical protein